MSALTVLGVSGSLRAGSYNTAALRAAQQLAPAAMTIETFDRLAEIPPYNQDDEKNPHDAVVELKRRARAADAILFATPEYNYSVPGVLKNAIDAASRPYGDNAWDGKPVAVISAAIGMLGGARAQYHLRQSFVFLNMYAVNTPEVMIPFAADRFDEQGTLTDEASKQFIGQLLTKLGELAQQRRGVAAPSTRRAGAA